MRLNAIRAQHKTIDNQAQDYDMAVTFSDVCAVVPAAGFGRRMQTECPKQYLGAHRRFKTRPPGEPKLYDKRG